MVDTPGIAFLGSGAFFSTEVFKQLVQQNRVPLVVIVPEYSGIEGRSFERFSLEQKSNQNPLIHLAKQIDLPVVYAPKKQSSHLQKQLKDYSIDFILVACWPYLLGEEICQQARKAALNLHPSLLPAYRGANPVEAQLANKETQFGVSLHLLSQTFDAGDLVKQVALNLDDRPANRQTIEQQAALLGTELFVHAMEEFGSSRWKPLQQLQ